MQTQKISYKGHRFPPRSSLMLSGSARGLREVEELMLVRGVDLSYETIRRWTAKFGSLITHTLRRRQPRPGDV